MTTVLKPIGELTWLDCPLNDAVSASFSSRLRTFVADHESEPIALFSPEVKATSVAGDWYGEHAGKWLCAASLAHARTKDEDLKSSIEAVVRSLAEWQEPNGSLSAYSVDSPSRMTHPEAPGTRTWDVWIHAWMIRGLLAASRNGLEAEGARESALRAGSLLLEVIDARNETFLRLGNHSGLSAAVVIDALAEASEILEIDAFLKGAETVLELLESGGISFISGPKRQLDASELGTGKIYQIIWVLLGMAKLARLKEDSDLLDAVRYWWQNIHDHHLTPFGGPWGGIGGHFEVFNKKGFFSPEGMVETCSTATWISLSRELFRMTGNPIYAAAFEKSLLNGILGAIDSNGADWSYFTFPNGQRNSTYHWACCKSSGALALEEAAGLPIWQTEKGFLVAMLQPCHLMQGGANITLRKLSAISWEVCVNQTGAHDSHLEILLPDWAEEFEELSRKDMSIPVLEGRRIVLRALVEPDSSFTFSLVVKPQVHSFTDTKDHHGQEIVRTDYAHISWGPYVYATGLFEGYRKQETLRLAKLFPLNSLIETPGKEFPTLQLRGQGRSTVKLEPFFLAGGQHVGTWRALWLQVAWQ